MSQRAPTPATTPPPAPPPGAGGPRTVRWLLLAAAVVVLAAAAGAIPRWSARSAVAAATRELAVPTVEVTSPMPGKPPVAPLLPAEVRPLLEASILARASGYVKRWTTYIGGQVEAGALLAELESPELEQELARSRQDVAQAEAVSTLSSSTAQRYQELAGTPGISDQELAEKQGDRAAKAAALDGARANVRRLEQLQAFTRIRAPFAGTVTVRSVDVGDLVVGGSGRELFRLAQSGTLRVSIRVPQAWTGGITVGQPAEVLIRGKPGKPLQATVARTAGAMSPESRTLLVELTLTNPGGEILAGSFAEARLLGAQRPAQLTLPGNTLLFRAEGLRVGVVGKDGKVGLRAVTLGRDFGRTVEVLSGVAAGEAVILNPSDGLVEGATVRVAAAREEGAGP